MKGLKKHWQISEFQFPKPYFQTFCSVKYRDQANTTYFSVVVCLRCLLHHIIPLIAYTFRENRGFVFITIVQFMMSSNIIRFFVHNTISLPSLCKLIWRHWTYKMPVRYILSSVWVRYILSVIHYTIYGAVCFQFANLPCDDWDDIYFVLLSSSNRKYELLPIV